MSVAPEPSNPEHDSMTIDPANLGSVDPLSVEGLFLVALGKQGDERAAFLAEQCGDDERRQRVEVLLAAYESAGSFLEKPAIAIEPTPMGQYLTPCEVPGAIGKLGPYEILEEIGRGGMGVVFRAHDPKLQRIVAVKALAPELARLPSARQRFLREARAAAAISHPHVVTIFAVDGTEEASLGTERATLPYLVMECIVGQTLHDKIKRQGALKTEEIVRISRQIAEGLGAAHKRGLIHRDIKPANILLENGVERVKITDFGLARSISDGGITHTGEILGTPQCMSPEQARGEIVDQRSDLFSLGCVMYTMCTGVSPFRADNMLAVMKKVCEVTPRPIAQLNPDIPEWLCSLVHQLLEKQAELRVQTAGEVVEVLEARAIHVAPPATTGMEPSFAEVVRGGWRSWIPDVIVSSAASGMIAAAMPHNMLIFPAFVFFAVAWLILLFAKRQGHGQWPWVTWPLGVASLVSLYLGMMLTVWVRMGNHSGSGMFVFGLAVGIFWLLTRRFPKLFIQTRSPQPVRSASSVAGPASGQSFESAAARPRSPWSVLGWMLVAFLGVGLFGGLLLAVAVIIPAYQARQAPRTDEPGTPYGFVFLNFPPGENVKTVTIDGLGVILRPGAENQWSMHAAPGPHTLFAEFSTDSTLNQVKTFKTTINVSAGRVTEIDAVPVVESKVPNNELTIPAPDSKSAAGEGLTAPVDPAQLRSDAPSPSIPLADAVEVLTDPAQMPIYPYIVGTSYAGELKTQVWIDEPGLIIRLKQLDFDGEEQAGLEFVSNPVWGVGYFVDKEHAGPVMEIPPGRYRVLVQDLDYGWSLDRRGTIIIGRGKQTIHVKRSFADQQLAPAEYPVPFRWAGKSYQLTTADQVSTINRYLAQLAGETAQLIPGSQANEMFVTHPLLAQFAMVNPPGEWTLKYSRQLIKLELPDDPVQESITFDHPQGVISWNRSVPKGFHIPEGDHKYRVSYEPGFGWPGDDQQAFDPEKLVDQTLVIGRLTKAMMREAVSREHDSDVQGSSIGWFREQSTMLSLPAVPAAKRLVLAWLDGQPDVPESELLVLGKVDSFESLWKFGVGLPADELMSAILVPGSTPGTWRLKEPPEGAVAKE